MDIRRVLLPILLTLAGAAAACSGGDDGGEATASGGDGLLASGDGPIAVSIEVASGPHAEGETIDVTVRLENVSADAVTVVRPFRVPAPVIFIVTDADGLEAGYEGLFGERRPLAADRFVELAPGESVDATFDLGDGYFLPAGEYEVIASYRNADDGADHGLSAFLTGDDDFSSPPATIEVE